APAEVLVADGVVLDGYFLTRMPAWQFDVEAGKRRLLKQLGAGTLAGYGCEDLTLAIGACGALLEYAGKTQGQALAHVTAVTAERAGEYVRLDAATRRNLELTETLRGETSPTLFSLLDECATGMGSRLLRHWLHHPLRDRDALRERHAVVACFSDSSKEIHGVLRGFSDVERISARLALKSVRPRELAGLRESLGLLPGLTKAMDRGQAPNLLQQLQADLAVPEGCLSLLREAIREEPAARILDGGVMADGYSAELDELRALQSNAGEFLARMEKEEREKTGIANLRVAYNSVHGYYIEVSNAQASKVPVEYRRRQTLKNAERYITPELKVFEDKALSARDRSLALEKSLYDAVLDVLRIHIKTLQKIAAALAQLDVLCCFAGIAEKRNFCRPVFTNEISIEIVAG